MNTPIIAFLSLFVGIGIGNAIGYKQNDVAIIERIQSLQDSLAANKCVSINTPSASVTIYPNLPNLGVYKPKASIAGRKVEEVIE
jgi:hypothetical protein